MQIAIGGDVVPQTPSEGVQCNRFSEEMFGSLVEHFKECDLSVVNLESPLTDTEKEIPKEGPCIKSPPSTVAELRKANIDAVNLANNHIMDYGCVGFRDTLSSLTESGISFFGAGRNLKHAKSPLTFDTGRDVVAIIGMAEHEFSIAGENIPGANPIDIIEFTRLIENRANRWDYLIVLIHGGSEGYKLPSPNLQKKCRFFVEQGADCVIVQHTHIRGSYEVYKDKPIVYGQGNLIFPRRKACRSWYKGSLLKVNLGQSITLDVVDYEYDIEEKKLCIDRNTGNKSTTNLSNSFEKVPDDDIVKKKWKKHSKSRKSRIMSRVFFPKPSSELLYYVFRSLDIFLEKVGFLEKVKLFDKNALSFLNILRCETHREVAIEVLKEQVSQE